MKIQDFTTDEESLTATFTTQGKKHSLIFDPIRMPAARMKIFHAKGNLQTFNRNEILKATGKHCPHVLCEAVEIALGEKRGALAYSGKAKVIDVYQSPGGTQYAKLSYSAANGRFFEIKRVPASFDAGKHAEIDCRIINEWEQMKFSTNGKSKSFKKFKAEILNV